MGDHVIRTSLLVQRGYLCETCGQLIDGQYAEAPRACHPCQRTAFESISGKLDRSPSRESVKLQAGDH